MVKKMLKDVKEICLELNQKDIREFSLVELMAFQDKIEKLYTADVLRAHESELECAQAVLAYGAISKIPGFYYNSPKCESNLKFMEKAMEINLEDAKAIKKFIHDESYNSIAENAKIAAEYRLKMFDIFNDIIYGDVDLNSYDYLYYYGIKVTENHKKIVDFIKTLADEKIHDMAKCTLDAFFRAADHMNIKKDEREYIIVFYAMGLEKVVKEIARIAGDDYKIIGKIMDNSEFDKQLNHNHRYDHNIYLDEAYSEHFISKCEEEYKARKPEYDKCMGPIYIESYGENIFVPENGNEIYNRDEEVTKIEREMSIKRSNIFNNYVRDNQTFCIISYPCPEIGKDFEKIFDDTITINTLDCDKYQKIQQSIIDCLDKADKVHITGRNGNKTDLTVSLAALKNPEKETKFENCLADCNVPLGEVFTSPKLEGTNGILNVSEIYLRGWKFTDLTFTIENGFVKDYSCSNYETEKENKTYIEEHILNLHPTLPMGEFAIGTNTHAYVMINKYNIANKMDILIAEKTGPHFAFGDTCYSYEEDIVVYNPDGKEIVAKDNEVTIKRKEGKQNEAYFGCHTDITIPYYELGDIVAISESGNENEIIKNGKFVLPGTEDLNIEGM